MFEGSLYGTPMQSLTLVIWGACRTSEGPSFEPLISKASNCDPFEGKGPLKEYSVLIRKRRRVASHARAGPPLVVGDVVRFVRCGVGAPFQATASGRRSGVGGG